MNLYTRQAGLALIEVVLALAIMLGSALVLMTLLEKNLNHLVHSRHHGIAMNLANEQLESLNFAVASKGLNAINTGNDSQSRNSHQYNRDWVVSEGTVPGSLIVTVTVSWVTENGPKKITLSTMMAGPAGLEL